MSPTGADGHWGMCHNGLVGTPSVFLGPRKDGSGGQKPVLTRTGEDGGGVPTSTTLRLCGDLLPGAAALTSSGRDTDE